jgi:hypothetical protein
MTTTMMTMRMIAMMRTRMMEEMPLHPLLLHPPVDVAPAAAIPEVDDEEEEDSEMMIPEHDAPEELEIIMSEDEPEPSQPCLFTMLMRDHEESPSRMFDDLDDPTIANYDVDEWFPEDGSCDRD